MSPTLIRDSAGGPRPSDPVFLALYPPRNSAERIAGLARHLRDEYKLAGRPLGEARFHLTLLGVCLFGQLTRDTYAAINDAAARVAMPPFLAGFDWAMSFGGGKNRPLVLRGYDGVAGVMLLRRELLAALRKIGFAGGRTDYTPHVTLLYGNHPIHDRPVEEIRWTVRDFVLVCSLYGRRRHIPLARWPLHG